jgi:hypothetical protein
VSGLRPRVALASDSLCRTAVDASNRNAATQQENPNDRVDRHLLLLKAVQVNPLGDRGAPIPQGDGVRSASGFIRRDDREVFLYVCWHTVTGLDRNDPRLPPAPAVLPRALRVRLQNVEGTSAGQRIGGVQEVIVPLYREDGTPAWLQDHAHIRHEELNSMGLFVPALHDAVKLRIPDVRVAKLQLVQDHGDKWVPLSVGHKVLIVGYPHGYSAFGEQQPAAIVLTRFIAATDFVERRNEILLDGDGAPGMSGGPVFADRDGVLHPIGIYTGNIRPGGAENFSLRLGTFTSLQTCWRNPGLALVARRA